MDVPTSLKRKKTSTTSRVPALKITRLVAAEDDYLLQVCATVIPDEWTRRCRLMVMLYPW